jgi:hypothetical protein
MGAAAAMSFPKSMGAEPLLAMPAASWLPGAVRAACIAATIWSSFSLLTSLMMTSP